MAAKPRIDIQVSVEDLEAEETYVAQLESLRLQLRSRDQLHRYFRPEPSLLRLTHVHVCSLGSEWEADHLLFRDYLRSHPEARVSMANLTTPLVAKKSPHPSRCDRQVLAPPPFCLASRIR
ncbi:MAG: GrpB family protein [Acidimicrobiales bacterium]